ncbi:MAG TPA: FAD-binding oxidoreductase [Hydrogenophaga sp.]|nr:FAD-binding oxidoreductase [Hydrogenophaga sp.]
MNHDPRSHGLWEASAPAAPQAAALSATVHADAVVVGAGYTGLSAALHLAQLGARVVVLEAQEVGFGGSGRNVGLVNAGMWVMPSALPDELGETLGNRLLTQLGNAPSLVFDLIEQHGMDCEPMRNGTLHCAPDAAGLRALQERARQWQALGAPVRVLSQAETVHKTGTDAYQGALLDQRAGTVQPLAYARGLAHAAVAAGAQLYTHTAVNAVHDAAQHWRLNTASGGVVHAPWVIVATNAYSGANGPWGSLQSELVRLPYFNLATAPLPPALLQHILPERQGAWDTRPVLTSFRLDRQGRLVLGSVGALRGMGRPIHRDWGHRALAKLFPQLRGMRFEHEWYGEIGMTANALPRFHQLARNTVAFSGYNGRGIAPGTVLGRELARLVLGEITATDLPLPVTDTAPAWMKGGREAFYEMGAQISHFVGAR